MIAKRFMYVCAGILMLAGAFALGASGARAQSSSRTIAGFTINSGYLNVITDDGDVWTQFNGFPGISGPPNYIGNFWNGTTPAAPASLGQVKARYR